MRTLDRKPGKFTHTTSDPMMTEEKFAELKNRLERLKKISQPKAASEVSRLAELGDFSENTEYQMAKWKLRGINNAILTIDNQLQQAIIIPSNLQSDTVRIGHKVTIQDGDKQKTYQILGSSETSPQKGIISHNSPIGSAILGHRVGEMVEIKLANKNVRYKIVRIE